MSLFFTICEVFLSSNISDVSGLNINGSKIIGWTYLSGKCRLALARTCVTCTIT